MKLVAFERNTYDKYLYIEWIDFPRETYYFKIYILPFGALNDKELFTITTNNWITDQVNYFKINQEYGYTYLIEAVDTSDTIIDSLYINNEEREAHRLEKPIFNILRYQAKVLLNNNNIIFKGFLLKPRKNGKPCSKCFVHELNTSANPQCPVCFGTGYEGGFYSTIPISLLPLQEQIQDSELNAPVPVSVDKVRFVVPVFPPINKGDYIIIPEVDSIYLVESTYSHTTLRKYTATNVISVSRLDKTHPIYKFKYDDTLTKVEHVYTDLENNKLIFKGQHLYPYIDYLKIIVYYTSDRKEYKIYSIKDIIKISDDELIFKGAPPVNSMYWGKINGMVYAGIVYNIQDI